MLLVSFSGYDVSVRVFLFWVFACDFLFLSLSILYMEREKKTLPNAPVIMIKKNIRKKKTTKSMLTILPSYFANTRNWKMNRKANHISFDLIFKFKLRIMINKNQANFIHLYTLYQIKSNQIRIYFQSNEKPILIKSFHFPLFFLFTVRFILPPNNNHHNHHHH